jgi:dipeptidyl aminopeptidase/acylaminoacyl peptidase
MRMLSVATLVLCACIMAVAAQPVVKVQLPCESSSQELSPTGAQLAVQCKDHSLQLVDLPSGTAYSVLPAGQGANTLAYSPDGHWLSAGFTDGTVEVIATADTASTRRWKADSHRIDLLYFFPDSKELFIGPVDSPGQVWVLSQSPVRRATLPVDFGGISAVAVSPDGKRLVAVGDDTVLRWYDTATWQKTRDYHGFLLETFALHFTPDGKQLLAGGADARVTVFDVASGKQLRQMPPEAGASVAFIEVLRSDQAAVVYFDDAGEKPPHALLWDMASATSVPIKANAQPTCGGVVRGRLQVCTVDGKMLTLSQYE